MTALAGRPHIMETEHFEEAARILARLEEGARLELIDGKVKNGERQRAAAPRRVRDGPLPEAGRPVAQWPAGAFSVAGGSSTATPSSPASAV
ncbi:ABC transporter [Streptomyces lydicamycinicus]|uniref:ABC transporter n=1 Tax=Streptomyces lydicamycinicus TaxID=1546107 RepID=A0A0P4R0M4_9ACTN|nr:ABC transporter [Streptomyces lydicamycinicus]